MEMMYGCGLRVSELIGLRLDALRMQGVILQVKGKGDKTRLVPIGGYARAALAKYLSEVRPGLVRDRRSARDAIFLSMKLGKPLFSPADEGVKVQAIIDAIYRSAKLGREVEVQKPWKS